MGDVVGQPKLAHKAVDEAHLAAEVIAGELQGNLSSHFHKFTHVFSDCHLGAVALAPTIAHSCDQGVEVGTSELPLERAGHALKVRLDFGQPLGNRRQAGEVVWGQYLALHDGEVDFDLGEPTRVHRAVNRRQSRMRLRETAHTSLAPVRRAVVHDPEHATRGVVRWLAHDLIDHAPGDPAHAAKHWTEQTRLLEGSMANGWTPERQARQAALIHTWRPWEKSTGPRRDEGKARTARNGFKGGSWCEMHEMTKAVNALLRKHRDGLRRVPK